jgi:hypothetical protein
MKEYVRALFQINAPRIEGLLGMAAGDDGAMQASTAVFCKVAVVNPVSGNAECVEPRGVAVDPPPPRPPPTKGTCLKHSDLGLKECQPT